jgi:hypothetical protein
MISRIKHFFSTLDVAQVLLTSLIIKLIATSTISYPEAFVVLGLTSYVGFRFYWINVKLKPLQEDTVKEVQELKNRMHKFEMEIKQTQAQVKPPTQRIWG